MPMQSVTWRQFHCACHPAAHGPTTTAELAWYRDGACYGVVLLDLVDRDYSWVVMGVDENEDDQLRCIDLGVSQPTFEAAKEALRTALRAQR